MVLYKKRLYHVENKPDSLCRWNETRLTRWFHHMVECCIVLGLYVLSDIELFYDKVLEQNLLARLKIDEYEVSSVATSVEYVGVASIFPFFFLFPLRDYLPKSSVCVTLPLPFIMLISITLAAYHIKKKSSAFPFFAIGKFLWWTPKKILHLQLDIGLALLAKG